MWCGVVRCKSYGMLKRVRRHFRGAFLRSQGKKNKSLADEERSLALPLAHMAFDADGKIPAIKIRRVEIKPGEMGLPSRLYEK